jgi:hypothetical protein
MKQSLHIFAGHNNVSLHKLTEDNFYLFIYLFMVNGLFIIIINNTIIINIIPTRIFVGKEESSCANSK